MIGRWFGKAAGPALAGVLAVSLPFGAALAQLQSQDDRRTGGYVGETTTNFGAPVPWGTGLQPGTGPVHDTIADFNSATTGAGDTPDVFSGIACGGYHRRRCRLLHTQAPKPS